MSSTIRSGILLFVSVFLYVLLIGPFTGYMKHKPIEEKLGFVPNANMLQYLSADQKPFVCAALLMKVIMYFGGLTDKQFDKQISAPPDYRSMSNIIHTALKLDPYNLDGYYFAQSFLTWDVKQYALANKLLDFGMKYRTWDWMLPFFAGFNSAYFLKDYSKAAEYYKRAAELSGNELHFSLAGRYMHESGQTEFAISYLSAMEKGERNPAVRKNYQVRLAAFKEVLKIEAARDRFISTRHRPPSSVDELVGAGLLNTVPVDPYGGIFYFEADGKVSTTSKFASVHPKSQKSQESK